VKVSDRRASLQHRHVSKKRKERGRCSVASLLLIEHDIVGGKEVRRKRKLPFWEALDRMQESSEGRLGELSGEPTLYWAIV